MAVHRPRTHSRGITVDQPADGLRSIVDNPTISLVPPHKFIDKDRPCRPSHPFLATTDDEMSTSSDDSSAPYTASVRMQEASSTLGFHMDNSVWDVIHKGVMDWREPNRTSMNLAENTPFTLCLPSWDAQGPAGLANDDGFLRGRRKQIVTQIISVQLLASCFTSPQNMNTLTLPSGWYNKNQTDDNWLNAILVSNLRQHTQWRHSPAFGHQARNNSAALLWPERDDALSREALLAEQVSLNRRLRQREDGDTKESTGTKRCRQNELSRKEPKSHHFPPLRHQRGLRKAEESASSHRVLQRRFGLRREALSKRDRLEQKNVLKVMRGLRMRNVGDDGHRWSLEPVLRSESHPVFVQPVKDYVMKRWRVFGSRSRNQSPTSASSEGAGKRPDYQRSASSTSRDSIQLSRRTQLMTMIQGKGTSLGPPAIDAKASPSPQASQGPKLTSGRASHDSINQTQTTAESGRMISIECSDEDLSTATTDYFCPTEWAPRRSLQSSESGQTRNRSSTSGTTIYNPPLIVEASPNSKKVESDGSISSGTSSGMRESKFLHEGDIISAAV